MLPIFYIQWTLFSLSPLNCYNFLKCSTNFTGACGMSCWIFCTYFWVVLHDMFCCLSSGTSICNRQKERDQLSQEKLMIAVFLRDFRSPVFFLLHKLKGRIQTGSGQHITEPSIQIMNKIHLGHDNSFHTCLLPTCDGQVLSLDSPRSDPGHRSCSWPSCPSTYRISAQHYVTA